GSKMMGHPLLDGVTVDIDLSGEPDIVNGLTLNSTMTVDGLAFGGTQTLSGAGHIVFGPVGDDGALPWFGVFDDVETATGSGSLTIGPEISIEGDVILFAGIGPRSSFIVNQGSISATSLDIELERFENQGSVQSTGDVRINVDKLVNSGSLRLGPGIS